MSKTNQPCDCSAEVRPELTRCLFDDARGQEQIEGLDDTGVAALVQDRMALLQRDAVDRPVVFVGAGTCGLGAGAAKTLRAVHSYLRAKRIDADVVEVGCIGLCAVEPMVDVQMPGRTRVSFKRITEDKVRGLLDGMFDGNVPLEHALMQHRNPNLKAWDDVRFVEDHPFFGPQTRWVLANCGVINPRSLDEYVAHGGYRAFTETIRNMTPAEVCDLVETSGLAGRGGGGFPTGRKWKFALGGEGSQKYIVCNADEGDPGAFMD
ncbi:MAG: NADH-quinone oxidoreductase subunit F, partial [bacterium]|nr:NADH-quinone oxidoreductase subunit F [bacterium]